MLLFAAGFLVAAVIAVGQAADHQVQPAGESRMSPADRTLLDGALAAYEHGESSKAEPVLSDLVKRYPARFEIVETLGLIYAERGELSRAVHLLEEACRTNSAPAPAWANLGVAYVRLNRNDETVRALDRAATLDPKNSQTQSSLGQALMLTNQPQKAAKAFAAAHDGQPEDPDILYNWGLAVYESGDARKAASILARIPARSLSVQAHSLLGDVEEQLGHIDVALAHYRDAARADPSEGNLDALGLELLKHWSFDGAARVYEYGVSRYPSSARCK